MFSVNIEKIVKMTETQEQSCKITADNILAEAGENAGIIAGIGDGMAVFKLASKLIGNNDKVLFVDADISEEIFLSKYRLGKNLSGVADYINCDKKFDELICRTNYEGLDVIFTGNITGMMAKADMNTDKLTEFFAEARSRYDRTVVLSDKDALFAAYADSVFVQYMQADYDEKSAQTEVDKLEAAGCNVLGVVLVE